MATYTDNYNLIKPTYAEVADIVPLNNNFEKIDEVMHSSQISLAPAYDQTKEYAAGDTVMYELLMYKCTASTTGVWDPSKWERTTASESGGGGSAELDILGEASGAVASFADGASAGLAKCIVDINPVQDLHGYSKPWAGGAGKNLFDSSAEKGESTNHVKTYALNLLIGTYTISAACYSTASTDCLVLFIYSDDTASPANTTLHNNTWSSVTINATKPVKEIRIYSSTNYSTSQNYTITLDSVQVESGSSATSYEPYSNICPITPRDEVNITVSATQGGSGEDTQIPLGRDVYGGTLNVKTGELTIDRVYLKLTSDLFTAFNNTLKAGFTDGDYLGQHIVACNALAPSYSYSTATDTASVRTQDGRIIVVPSWASECTDLASFKTAYANQTELEVVHTITPQTVQLTPQEVNSILGQNNISADTGDIDVVYVKASAPIQPNPTGEPTATLNKLGIEGTVFEVPSGGGGSSGGINYSTTEQVIGTWIDGKTLYQRTFDLTAVQLTDNNWNNNILGTIGIRIKHFEGLFSVGQTEPSIKYEYYRSATQYFSTQLNDDASDINVRPNMNAGTLYAGMVTVQYTKITD